MSLEARRWKLEGGNGLQYSIFHIPYSEVNEGSA